MKENSVYLKKRLLEFLTIIPKGKITTYKELANFFNVHPRTIARILSLNKEQEKYPCYKVVRSNGDVGGYNLGVKKKIEKLKEEGIEVDEKGKIKNFEKHFYKTTQ